MVQATTATWRRGFRPASSRRARLLVLFLLWVPALDAQPERRPLPMPDIPGYVTLKGDFHLHSVFSDGDVWPTVHVREAYRDGLDVVSLTEHLEYRPHKGDVPGGAERAYEIARSAASGLGMLVVPGVELTRPIPNTRSDWPVGSAHFNVLFPTDISALDTADLYEALARARAQGAFVFWNHPGFMGKPATWFPHVGVAFDRGLVNGIEVVNGDQFYPEALEWADSRRLTRLACSDAHQPMPAHLKSARRPITLLFTKQRDVDGVKEALTSGRTLAWLDRRIWGSAALLEALWLESVRVEPSRGIRGGELELTLQNASAVPFEITVVDRPTWLSLREVTTLNDAGATLWRGTLGADAPTGVQSIQLTLEVSNLRARADTPLKVTLPVSVEIVSR